MMPDRTAGYLPSSLRSNILLFMLGSLILLPAVLLIHGFSLAEESCHSSSPAEAGQEAHSSPTVEGSHLIPGAVVPESYTLQGTPSGLGDQAEFAFVDVIEENGHLVALAAKDDLCFSYLLDTDGILNAVSIEEIYRNNYNPYGMPLLTLIAPIELEKLEPHLGKDLVPELAKQGRARDGKLADTTTFFAVGFKKQADRFAVTHWLPESLLHAFSQGPDEQ